MWELRDHKYGGRAKRFREGPRGLGRCLDPISRQPVSVSSELKFENWLLLWGDVKIRSIAISPTPMACISEGRLLTIKPDFFIQWCDTDIPNDIQFVVQDKNKIKPEKEISIKKISAANNVTYSFRTRELIRSNLILLRNLKYLRQCSVIHADEIHSILKDRILIKLSELKTANREDLVSCLAGCYQYDSEIDSVLLLLRQQKIISIDIESNPIGKLTRISLIG